MQDMKKNILKVNNTAYEYCDLNAFATSEGLDIFRFACFA